MEESLNQEELEHSSSVLRDNRVESVPPIDANVISKPCQKSSFKARDRDKLLRIVQDVQNAAINREPTPVLEEPVLLEKPRIPGLYSSRVSQYSEGIQASKSTIELDSEEKSDCTVFSSIVSDVVDLQASERNHQAFEMHCDSIFSENIEELKETVDGSTSKACVSLNFSKQNLGYRCSGCGVLTRLFYKNSEKAQKFCRDCIILRHGTIGYPTGQSSNAVFDKNRYRDLSFLDFDLTKGIHVGIICRNETCSKEWIRGPRFNCTTCRELGIQFNLCRDCFEDQRVPHDEDHVFFCFQRIENCLRPAKATLKVLDTYEVMNGRLLIPLESLDDLLSAISFVIHFPQKLRNNSRAVLECLIALSCSSRASLAFWKDLEGDCGISELLEVQSQERAKKAFSNGFEELLLLDQDDQPDSLRGRLFFLLTTTSNQAEAVSVFHSLTAEHGMLLRKETLESYLINLKMASPSTLARKVFLFLNLAPSSAMSEKDFVQAYIFLHNLVTCAQCHEIVPDVLWYSFNCSIALCSQCFSFRQEVYHGELFEPKRSIDFKMLSRFVPKLPRPEMCFLTRGFSTLNHDFSECLDCNVLVCEGCSRACHSGHRLQTSGIKINAICDCRLSKRCKALSILSETQPICSDCNALISSFFITKRNKILSVICSLCIKNPHTRAFFPSPQSLISHPTISTRITIHGNSKDYFPQSRSNGIHWGIKCTGIQCEETELWIRGMRYVCATCFEKDNIVVNLCRTCVLDGQSHDSSHAFIALKFCQDVFPVRDDVNISWSTLSSKTAKIKISMFSSDVIFSIMGLLLRESRISRHDLMPILSFLSLVHAWIEKSGSSAIGEPFLFFERDGHVILELYSKYLSQDEVRVDISQALVSSKASLFRTLKSSVASLVHSVDSKLKSSIIQYFQSDRQSLLLSEVIRGMSCL